MHFGRLRSLKVIVYCLNELFQLVHHLMLLYRTWTIASLRQSVHISDLNAKMKCTFRQVVSLDIIASNAVVMLSWMLLMVYTSLVQSC